MSHILTLQLPEQVYEPLAKTAAQTGISPERLAVEWLKASSFHAARDPVEPFIGAFATTNAPGWADRHDELLGEALHDELTGNGLTEN